VAFSRYHYKTENIAWEYDQSTNDTTGILTAIQKSSNEVKKPMYGISNGGRGFHAKPMVEDVTSHRIELKQNSNEAVDEINPSGTVTYKKQVQGRDNYQKWMKLHPGEDETNHEYDETKTYSGRFGITSNTNMFDLMLLLTDDVTGELYNVCFKCTHHPLNNKQWPAIDNPEAEGEYDPEGMYGLSPEYSWGDYGGNQGRRGYTESRQLYGEDQATYSKEDVKPWLASNTTTYGEYQASRGYQPQQPYGKSRSNSPSQRSRLQTMTSAISHEEQEEEFVPRSPRAKSSSKIPLPSFSPRSGKTRR